MRGREVEALEKFQLGPGQGMYCIQRLLPAVGPRAVLPVTQHLFNFDICAKSQKRKRVEVIQHRKWVGEK